MTALHVRGHLLTETDELAQAIDDDAALYPGETRADVLRHLVELGAETIAEQQDVILNSDDGLTWSSTSINELTGGQPSDVAWIRTTAAATTVGIWVEASSDSTTPSATCTSSLQTPLRDDASMAIAIVGARGLHDATVTPASRI